MDVKKIIMDRQHLRFVILEKLYWKWFESSRSLIGTKKEIYGKVLTDEHLAVAYLHEKGFITIDVSENPTNPREEKLILTITATGIDYVEEHILNS
ncbi:hypothetical protein [Paenibacillus campi]|uniref:hypothetical protein n=1 Tax=Paenibacillus campi TaxID=3106031 RepID=UPI002AFF79BB|nr:hypothetical protein [Paenibacillus sp. SGZ-1014]